MEDNQRIFLEGGGLHIIHVRMQRAAFTLFYKIPYIQSSLSTSTPGVDADLAERKIRYVLMLADRQTDIGEFDDVLPSDLSSV